MKRLFISTAIIVIIIIGISFLYRSQLGAIPFLLLAVFFFTLAFQPFIHKKKLTEDEEINKRNLNNK